MTSEKTIERTFYFKTPKGKLRKLSRVSNIPPLGRQSVRLPGYHGYKLVTVLEVIDGLQ